jgi:hypothetical protein
MRKHGKRYDKRRRHDPQSRQCAVARTEEADNTNDIEEQLRKQRRKKLSSSQPNSFDPSISKTEASSVAAFSTKKKKTLGKYTYDPFRGAYFPTDFVKDALYPTHQRFIENDFCNARKDFRLPPVVHHSVQLLHGSAKRRRFVVHWAGQIIKDSLSIQSLNDFYVDQMRLPLPELRREEASSSPWCRCFGVVSSRSCSGPPKVFTLHNSPYSHGKELSCDKGIGCLDTSEGRTTFVTYDLAGNRLSYSLFYDEINDFTQMQHYPDRTVFGGNKCFILSVHADSWYRMESSTGESTIPSDILCVESDRSGAQPDLVFFGQRNGQVLIYDLRTSLHWTKIAGTLSNRKRNDTSVDSVFRIKTMFEHRPDQLLVRGRSSWGVCDLRGLGGCVIGDKSLVQKVSFANIPDHLSIPAKGMAIDPLQSTIIVPFWNKVDAKDKLNKFSLKFWSLESGSYLGAKVLRNEVLGSRTNDAGVEGQCLFASTDLELCPTLTHAWSFNATFAETGASKETKKDGAFGLWLNVGTDYINHISCDGRHS